MGSVTRIGLIARRAASAHHLRASTAPAAQGKGVFTDSPGGAPGRTLLADRARAIYDARRRRDALFGKTRALFHDPAWDILLDLFIQGEEHQIVSVSSACVGSCAPHSTALRCLKAMERQGVIGFSRDPFDKRRCFVALTRDTHRRMALLLADIGSGQGA